MVITDKYIIIIIIVEEKSEEESFPLSKAGAVSRKRYRTEVTSKKDRSPVDYQTGREQLHSSKEKESRGRSSKERLSGERKSSQQSRAQPTRDSQERRGRTERHDYMREVRTGGDRGSGGGGGGGRVPYRHSGYHPDRDNRGRTKRGERLVVEAHSRRRSPYRQYDRPAQREEQRSDYDQRLVGKEDKRGSKRPWSSRDAKNDQRSSQKVSSSSEESDSDSAEESVAKKVLHDREGIDSLLRDLASGSSGMLSSTDSDSETEKQKNTKRKQESGSAKQPVDSSQGEVPGGPPETRSGSESESSTQDKHDNQEGEEEVAATAEEVIRRGRWYSGYDEELESSRSESAGEEAEEDRPKVFSGSEPEQEREGEEENKEEEEVEKEDCKEQQCTPPPELPAYYPATMGCRNVEKYEWLNRIEEGTYGVVYRAKDKRTGECVQSSFSFSSSSSSPSLSPS